MSEARQAQTTVNISYSIPGFAKGGDAPAGLKLVGEEGPEFINTGPGRIFDAVTTRKMMKGAGSDGNSAITARLDAIYALLAQGNKSNADQMDEQTGKLSDVHRQLKNVEAKLT